VAEFDARVKDHHATVCQEPVAESFPTLTLLIERAVPQFLILRDSKGDETKDQSPNYPELERLLRFKPVFGELLSARRVAILQVEFTGFVDLISKTTGPALVGDVNNLVLKVTLSHSLSVARLPRVTVIVHHKVLSCSRFSTVIRFRDTARNTVILNGSAVV